MMSKEFTAEIPNNFIRELNKLPESVRKLVDEYMEDIVKKPTIGKYLKDSQLWSDRVGGYRILYRVDFRNRNVQFFTVEKRSKAYQRR